MNFRITPMTAAHLPAVAALEKACFPADPWSEELFRGALSSPHACVLLALGEDGGILGYAVVSAVLDEGNLDNIAVARPARRQGVADALLSALALYEKHGFAAVGRRKHYYTAPREDAVLMTLEFGHGTETA